jgi:hypothetical protein
VYSVEFPDNPFDSVSFDRPFYSVNTDAEPVLSFFAGSENQAEMIPAKPFSVLIDTMIFSAFSE